MSTCPRCRRTAEQCALRLEADGQAEHGGRPREDSSLHNGPLWTREKWRKYGQAVVRTAKADGCLDTSIDQHIEELTRRKEQNNEFID